MKDKITGIILSCCAIIGGIFTFSFKDFNLFKKEPGVIFDGNKALNSFLEKKYESIYLENETLQSALKDALNNNQINLEKLSTLRNNLSSLEDKIKEASKELKNTSNQSPYFSYFLFLGIFAIFYATKYFILKRKIKNSKKILATTIDFLKKDNLALNEKREQIEKIISSQKNLNEKIKNFNANFSNYNIETSKKTKQKIRNQMEVSIKKIKPIVFNLINARSDDFRKNLETTKINDLNDYIAKIQKKFVENRSKEFSFRENSHLLYSVAVLILISQIIEFGMTDEVRTSFLSNLDSAMFVNSSYNIELSIKDFENPSKHLWFRTISCDEDLEKFNKQFITKCNSLKLKY